MPAVAIFRRARVSRCTIAASDTRNPLATSAVLNPHTVRSVNATCASWDRAGWQQVNSSRSRSSSCCSTGSDTWASFARNAVRRRSTSTARRRAAVHNQAPGRSGTPSTGHCCHAANGLTVTTPWK